METTRHGHTRLAKLALAVFLGLLLTALAHAEAGTASTSMRAGFQDDAAFTQTADPGVWLDRAATSGARIVRATAHWPEIAPTRPTRGGNPADPAYRFDELDALVTGAAARGLAVLITINGTPGWANRDRGENRLPRRLGFLRAFAKGLARRYDGTFNGLPAVTRYSVWNEPNKAQFLTPQYNARGRSVAPILYSRLYRAASRGLRRGNPAVQVAIGETSPRGRTRPPAAAGAGSHPPARFARLLAAACDDRCMFDAYAHHPHPPIPSAGPVTRVRWPNVGLRALPRLERKLARWFRLSTLPRMWITEYGHRTDPPQPGSVTPTLQKRFLAKAMRTARKDPQVDMFVWFVLRDDPAAEVTRWEAAGGLYDASDAPKPALQAFRSIAATLTPPVS